jgi:hypothetical protein
MQFLEFKGEQFKKKFKGLQMKKIKTPMWKSRDRMYDKKKKWWEKKEGEIWEKEKYEYA